MYERGFRDWLISQGIGSYSTYLARITRIEEYYGNINTHYDTDRCAWLLTQFEYTKEDRDNKREPKCKLQFVSVQHKDIYQTYLEGIRDYATRIRRYRDFRDDTRYSRNESSPPPNPNPNGNEKPPIILPIYPPVGNPNEDNSRYRGNPIGNAQNLFIRNLLSNLGKHSFSEKNWGETKRYFEGKCVYCGTVSNEVVMDHAIPINKEKLGEHRLGNLVPACKACNSKKHWQDYIEFCKDNIEAVQKIKEYMASRGYVPLTDDEEKANSIRKILETAHKEIGDAADRYITMINALFF